MDLANRLILVYVSIQALLFKEIGGCGGHLTLPSGTIQATRTSYSTCNWVISTEKDKRIYVFFKSCPYGHSNFEIYEKINGRQSLVTTRCTAHKLFKSSSNWIKIRGTVYQNRYYVYGVLSFMYKTGPLIEEIAIVSLSKPIEITYRHINDHELFVSGKTWKISNTDPTGTLTLDVVSSVSVNQPISVYDGNTKNNTLIMSMSLTSSTVRLFSTSKDMLLSWKNSFRSTKNISFTATIKTGCVSEISNTSGVIESPRYFDDRMKCSWIIRNPNGVSITFYNTMKFALYDGVFEVTDRQDLTIGKFNRFNGKKRRLLSSSSKIIKFTFVHSNTTRGHKSNATFKINFSKACTPVLHVTGGYIVGDHHYGSKIEYFCNESYYLINGKYQYCEFGGVWSNPKPYCKAWTNPILNSSHEAFIPAGSNVSVACTSNEAFNDSTLALVNSDGMQIGNSLVVDFAAIQPIVSNRYRCMETYQGQNMYSQWLNIVVTWLEKPHINTSDAIIPTDSSIKMRCVVKGFPKPSYVWYHNGNMLSGENHQVLIINKTTLDHDGDYFCNATNALKSESSNVTRISVWDLGEVVVQSTIENIVLIGSYITMHCNCTGNAEGIQYHWIKDDVKIVSNTSVYVIPGIEKRDSGNYKCKAIKENRFKSSRKLQTQVAWLDKPVLTFAHNQSTVPIFTSVQLRCMAAGYPKLARYVWYKDNVVIKKTFSAKTSINVISTAYTGKYSCKAINSALSKVSEQKRLVVWNLDTPSISTNHEGSVPLGENVTMRCDSNEKNLTLSWVDKNGKIVSLSSIYKINNLRQTDAGRYRCKATKRHLSVYSRFATIDVTYLNKPTLEIFPSRTAQIGNSVDLICRAYGSRPITYNIIKNGQVVEKRENEGTSLIITYAKVSAEHAGTYSCSASNNAGMKVSQGTVFNVISTDDSLIE